MTDWTPSTRWLLISFVLWAFVPMNVAAQEDENKQQEKLQKKLQELEQTIEKQEKQNEKLREQINQLKENVDDAEESGDEKYREKVDELEMELAKLKFQMPENPDPVLPEGLRTQEEPNALNPMITVFSNHLYRADNKDVVKGGSRVDETYRLRANEIDLRSPIGPYGDGVAILAAPEQPNGQFDVKFEELYATLKDYPFFAEPPLDMRLKAGRFRTELGRLNRLHFHDLPQPDRPYAFREFIGGGGWQGEGLSARFQLPTDFIDEESALELTGQVLEDSQGFRYAEAGDAGTAVEEPAALGNLRWSRSFSDEHFMDLSFIHYHGYSDSDIAGEQPVTLQSVDALYKWKPAKQGEWTSFILAGQVYWGNREFVNNGTEQRESPFGGFAWTQYQFDKRWYAGARYDYSEDLLNDDLVTRAAQPYITYKWNEALQTRIGFRRQWSDIDNEDGLNTFFFELTFWFGSHPPHPFWVEK